MLADYRNINLFHFRLVEEVKQKCDIVLTNEDVYMHTE